MHKSAIDDDSLNWDDEQKSSHGSHWRRDDLFTLDDAAMTHT